MRGVQLEATRIMKLERTNTLVYVEEMNGFSAQVVALPDQPQDRDPRDNFTPGAVRAKRIDLFAEAEPVENSTPTNLKFIEDLATLRENHGLNFVVPSRVTEEPTDDRKKSSKKSKDPADAPVARRTGPRQTAAASSFKLDPNFTLDAAAAAHKRFKPGNKGALIVKALGRLPDMTGTVENVLAVLAQNPDWSCRRDDPAKFVRRVLVQLTGERFGGIVTKL